MEEGNCLGALKARISALSDNEFVSERESILSGLPDPVLQRRLRRLRQRKNAISEIDSRISFLAAVAAGKVSHVSEKTRRLYASSVTLSIDKDKCLGCDVSHKVCPKESIEVKETAEIKDSCVLCGLCVPFCPTGAMSIRIDGKDQVIMAGKSLPAIGLQEGGIKRLFEGSISIRTELCPPDCEKCVSACPTGLIERTGKGGEPVLDPKKCVLCGACRNACPKDAIAIERSRLRCSDDGFSAALTSAIRSLVGESKANVHHNAASLSKIESIMKKDFKEYLE